MHSLPVFLRLEGRPVILIGTGEAAEAKRRLLLRTGARVVGEDEPAALAIVALEDDEAAAAAVQRLAARGILVNAVDRAALCDFTLPAIVDRDPVLIAIGTGGASAGLAKALRQRLEALMPAGLGGLADSLHGARAALRNRFPDPATRRRMIDAALDPGGRLDPFGDPGEEAVDRWLTDPVVAPAPRLVEIALRSADPDDLTLGEARALAGADAVYHDPGIAPAILNRARADAPRIAGPPRDLYPGLNVFLHDGNKA
jgi:uroporphyrin-III C-methyltransferase/precorrin-2 dehydrogenase/sirohydrochlorin ferrochelatase